MHYSYVEIEYVAMSFSPARTDLALKLLNPGPWQLSLFVTREEKLYGGGPCTVIWDR